MPIKTLSKFGREFAKPLYTKNILNLGSTDIQEIQNEVHRNGVVCVKNANFTSKQMLDFTRKFGEAMILPKIFVNFPEPGLPEVMRIGNIRHDGTYEYSTYRSEYYHHDGDMYQHNETYMWTFLMSKIIPQVGGNTNFIDTISGYEALTKEEKELLENSYFDIDVDKIPDFKDRLDGAVVNSVRHNVINIHPVTKKKYLYLSYNPTPIKNSKGNDLNVNGIDIVTKLINRVGEYEHKWKDGDLVIWDNLQCIHRATGGYGENHRLLFRTQTRMNREGKLSD